MSLFPGSQESCFYLDPNAGLTDSGLWKDSSPFSCHVTPVGYSSPAYGIVTGPSGAEMITFNGANQWGTLPVRFYANMPLTEITVACVARHATSAGGGRIFSARTNAPLTGIEFLQTTSNRLGVLGYDGIGGTSGAQDSTDVPLQNMTRVSVLSSNSLQTIIRSWHDRNGSSVVGGGAGITSWVVAVTAPYVGSSNWGAVWGGDLYHLSIYNRVWSHSEAQAFSDYFMDRI